MKKEKKVGGIAFLLSFITLSFLALLLVGFLPFFINQNNFFSLQFGTFALGILSGVGAAILFVRSSVATLIHEFKHAIVSGLAGNKWKKLDVSGETGSFEYEYTKKTAVYNAFILVAPYFFPLFFIPFCLFALVAGGSSQLLPFLLIGIGLGADLATNIREIGPHQSDLRRVRGGKILSLGYVIAANLSLIIVVSIWAAEGWTGIVKLVDFSIGVLDLIRIGLSRLQ